jgi:hypothetical protein
VNVEVVHDAPAHAPVIGRIEVVRPALEQLHVEPAPLQRPAQTHGDGGLADAAADAADEQARGGSDFGHAAYIHEAGQPSQP